MSMQDKALFEEIARLKTEMANPLSENLDTMSTNEVLTLINSQDALVPAAVARVLDRVEAVVKACVASIEAGGRVVYIGAGTSGRLGILDAAETWPTFSVPPGTFVGLIAGGKDAVFVAKEFAEDQKGAAVEDLKSVHLNRVDTVVGLSASGRTPYVIEGLQHAKKIGCSTGLITTNPKKSWPEFVDQVVCVDVGPEVIAGSTRMKSALAQMMILHMISTATMVATGRVYGNLMVDVHATTRKTTQRAVRIIMLLTGLEYDQALRSLRRARGSAKLAVLMVKKGIDLQSAQGLLQKHKGSLRAALEE